MSNKIPEKVVDQLIAVVNELSATCTCLRDNTAASKTIALLQKRYTEHMYSLLLERGIETTPAVITENTILVEHNVILMAEAEEHSKALRRLQAKLDALQQHVLAPTEENSTAHSAGA